MSERTQHDLREEFLARRRRVRDEMGSTDRIERQHDRGRLTIRERFTALLDADSFVEIGTFARSERPEDHARTPGDGKITGWGTIDGRPVAVAGDDVTVLHGSSSVVGQTRTHRVYEHALRAGMPYVYFGETGGARLPDTLGSEGFSRVSPQVHMGQRNRQIPMATAIVGESFGGSSFQAAFSDFVVQVRGSSMGVSSPRVIAVATGAEVSLEELGGVDVHLNITGQIDCAAESEEEACAILQQFLAYLPSNSWSLPPDLPFDEPLAPDPALLDVAPLRRNRAYDMHRMLARIVDGGDYLELKPRYGRSAITALARLGGKSVGIVASNPMFYAGALSPETCDKITAFLCLCDSFNLPLVFLQDTPGFIVGKQPEHSRLLHRAIMLIEALSQVQVPRVTVVIRKAFGLAYFALSGNSMETALVMAWPGAEISFMDPAVGVNVVHAKQFEAAADPEAERARLVEEWSRDVDPFGAAGIMNIDEVIDPADTRAMLIHAVRMFRVEPPRRGERKPLASWPTCY